VHRAAGARCRRHGGSARAPGAPRVGARHGGPRAARPAVRARPGGGRARRGRARGGPRRGPGGGRRGARPAGAWAAPRGPGAGRRAGDARASVLVVAGAGAVVGAALLGRSTPAGGGWRAAAALRLTVAGVRAATAGTVESLHVAHVAGGGAVFAVGLAWALAAGGVALGAGLVAARVAPA